MHPEEESPQPESMNPSPRELQPSHVPVLLAEVLEALSPCPGECHLDGTLGLGGHASEVFRRTQPEGVLLGIDKDQQALELARERLRPIGASFELFQGSFHQIDEFLRQSGRAPEGALDGLLLDLGVSSLQLDLPGRGFSFQQDGPLDMRMDASQGESVEMFLRRVPTRELEQVLRDFGEERAARRIARAIDSHRATEPIRTTSRLAEIVESVSPRKGQRIHPATRTFQALRIAVNRELEHLRLALRNADRWMRPGGRVVVLSYHSLEDRIVKQSFAEWHREGLFELPRPGLLRPSPEEIDRNPRSRSARLRLAVRC